MKARLAKRLEKAAPALTIIVYILIALAMVGLSIGLRYFWLHEMKRILLTQS